MVSVFLNPLLFYNLRAVMRFIIHGAGAIGSLVGGKLAQSGAEVILIARAAHAATINQKGLLIRTRDGDQVVKDLRAVLSPSEIKPQSGDVIILTVKTQQTAASVQSLRVNFPENTPIICMQNGVRNEEVAACRFLNVYGAMTGLCVNFTSPGVVAHTRSSLIGIGNYPFGCDALASDVAEQLKRSGFDVSLHESIMAVKWNKLLLNLNNATYAIIDSYLQLGLVTPPICKFTAEVIEEGLDVVESAGIHLDDPQNRYDLRRHIAELKSVIEDHEKVCQAKNLPVDLRTYPSTWIDLKLKRGGTEAGYFNGEIILLGEKLQMPTPYNSVLLQIVESMAAQGAAPGRYTLDQLTDLVNQKRLMLYYG